MATLVLQTAGQALGGFLGGPIGAAIGSAAGGIAGSIVDQALFAPPPRQIEGPRLNDLHVTGSTEGAPIPQIWGRMRVAGQLIWATNFEEQITHRSEGGGKGSLSRPTAEFTEYAYFANFAIALGDGPVDRIGRMWADGKEINPASISFRFYNGSDDQQPDSLIEAKEGADNAPAYRGLAYIVFERLPLQQFGNRIPQLSFEVFRQLDGVETQVRAINIIPGSTEFGYDTEKVRREDGFGGTITENVHTFNDLSDFTVSLDQLQATCTNVGAANLVVAWFGDDLRCGDCLIEPRVDNKEKQTEPVSWSVAGLNRSSARLVSGIDGRAAFGGTPDDGSIVRSICEMNARGLEVCFYPFILMDIAPDNQKSNPYTGEAGQPAYPWRGQITCSPAIGQPGTADQTAQAASQISDFFGTAEPSHFSISGGTVFYSGPAEWSYRRFILHYANLCKIAGNVEAFLIGSEMVALNAVRDEVGSFVAVAKLKQLASEVASILPDTKISYAADWSEYSGYRPSDGSNDVWFHLDELWADPSVDFVGIDNYMPLSDWRNGDQHQDRQAGWLSIHDKEYLKFGIEGGEGYDWFYASQSDRLNQNRTPIVDSAEGKHWVFRVKDLRNWWSNQHFNRLGGVEAASATAWQPEQKPIRFTEFGFPAVDKATNQPNVFFDHKSANSQLPYFSSGTRDDLLQRLALSSVAEYWSEASGNNPVSAVYGGPMLDTGHMAVWAWDARPYPAFPFLADVWSDGGNHQLGHWLNGRLGALGLRELVTSILERFDVQDFDVSELQGVVEGFQIDRPMSARAALAALSDLFMFDTVEREGQLVFTHRANRQSKQLNKDALVRQTEDDPVYELRRAQETELPETINLSYAESGIEYRRGAVSETRLDTTSSNKRSVEFAGVMSFGQAQGHVRRLLNVSWASREAATFVLPPSQLELEPGDVISLSGVADNQQWRMLEASGTTLREVSAQAHSDESYALTSSPNRRAQLAAPAIAGRVQFAALDLPLLTGSEDPYAPWVAASARPWPGQVNVLKGQGGDSLANARTLTSPAIMGKTLSPLTPGPCGVGDRGARLLVRLSSGQLQSRNELDVLAGANTAVVGSSTGQREVIQFQKAELMAPLTYKLSNLLRAQAGTDLEMAGGHPESADFVLMDGAVRQLPASMDNVGLGYLLRYGPGNADVAGETYQTLEFGFQARGLRPFSPAYLRAEHSSAGIDVSWIRRTRLGGDSWELAEVPLSEDTELYEVDVSASGQVVRTLQSAQPTITYTSVDQQQDFPAGLPDILSFDVYQISATYGRGAASKVIFNV